MRVIITFIMKKIMSLAGKNMGYKKRKRNNNIVVVHVFEVIAECKSTCHQ